MRYCSTATLLSVVQRAFWGHDLSAVDENSPRTVDIRRVRRTALCDGMDLRCLYDVAFFTPSLAGQIAAYLVSKM